MISTVLKAIAYNFQAMPGMDSPAVTIGYAEQISDQGGPRQLLMYPTRGRGDGPNFYTAAANPAGQMVRKVWINLRFEIWGLPDTSTPLDLAQMTDDTELMRNALVSALPWSIPGNFHLLDELWTTKSMGQAYGRCCTMDVEYEAPLVLMNPLQELAPIAHVSLTATLEDPA